MAEYQVGSVASFVTQQSSNEGVQKKDETKKNKEILDQLFAVSDTATTVQHVPVAPDRKVKKKKRQADDFKITEIAKGKKIKKEGYDDEEVEKILNLPDDEDADEADETEVLSENAGQRLKRIEIKNIKKNAAKKGKLKEEDKDHVVIVKNLPIKVKRKSIRSLFSKCGKVDAVWLRCAALSDAAIPKKVAIIKQDFHPDRQSITAFVRFEDTEAAKKAASLTGTIFQEHHLSVSLISEDSRHELSKAIFVGNLDFGVEDEALWDHFGECGPISDVRLIRDSSSGIGKGFGYVNFQSADSVELAMRLNGSLLKGREIRVERCKNKPKKPKNFGERLNTKKTEQGGRDAKSPSFKKNGAYRRIQKKNKSSEKPTEKSNSWQKSMKERQKALKPKPSSVHSFAGEATVSDNKAIKPKRLGKTIKKNKAESRKKVIAAKLTTK